MQPKSSAVIVGPCFVAGAFQVREIRYPPAFALPPHAHAETSLTLVVAGSLSERVGRRDEHAGPLSVVAKPAGVEHANEVGYRGARTLQIVFDADALEGEAGRAFDAWRWIHGGVAARPLLALARTVRRREGAGDGPRRDRDPRTEIEEVVLDAVAAMSVEASDDAPPPWLARAKEALDDQLPAPVAVRELAALVGAHPVSVSRAFRRHFGCTIGEYRKRARLRRAAARIQESRQPISRVAHASGYADHPHLCRDFRRATGMTPGEFRRLWSTA